VHFAGGKCPRAGTMSCRAAKGGKEIAPTCHSCEDYIHKTWTHNELRDTFNTVEKILSDPRFQKFHSGFMNSRRARSFGRGEIVAAQIRSIGSGTSGCRTSGRSCVPTLIDPILRDE